MPQVLLNQPKALTMSCLENPYPYFVSTSLVEPDSLNVKRPRWVRSLRTQSCARSYPFRLPIFNSANIDNVKIKESSDLTKACWGPNLGWSLKCNDVQPGALAPSLMSPVEIQDPRTTSTPEYLRRFRPTWRELVGVCLGTPTNYCYAGMSSTFAKSPTVVLPVHKPGTSSLSPPIR